MDTEKFKMGWLLVCFDLPVGTKEERKHATDFRNFLLDDGYLMIQFSVYARPCVTFARQETHLRRLGEHVPDNGTVRAMFITRFQWQNAYSIQGKPNTQHPPEEFPEQLQLW